MPETHMCGFPAVSTRLVAMVVLALLACNALSAAGQSPPALAIVSPAAGTVVSPGQTLTVNVTSPAGVAFASVAIVGEQPLGILDFATSVPALFSVTIPADAPCREYALTVLGSATSGPDPSAQVLINVERSDLPLSISGPDTRVPFGAQGETAPLIVLGHFDGDTVLDVTESSNMTYVSSDPTVATVDSNGVVTAIAAGRASITATYGPPAANLRLTIRVDVPAPLFTVTPSSLEFGNRTLGTSSQQEMTVTNSSGEPLTIVGVTAGGDYSATDTCVASSPLAENATCTITVTFTPTAAGGRQGAVEVANNLRTVSLWAAGTGVTPPSGVQIVEFTPPTSPVGASVTITGTGFSATASENTVAFNGTTASIGSASTTSLVVTVPSGATTGPIAVTAPAGSATSSSSFTVTVPDPPTITGFTPTIGVAGTSVTIAGANFSAVPANNQTTFNNGTSVPAASTATTVTGPGIAASFTRRSNRRRPFSLSPVLT